MTLAHSTVSLQSRSSTARTFLRYARSQSVAQGRHSPISHISSTTSISPSSSRRRAHLPLSRFYSLDARTGSSPSPASSPSSASSSQSQSQGADGHSRESSSSSTTSSAGSSGSRRRHGQFRRTMNLMAWLPVAAFITSHVCSIGNVTGGSMSVSDWVVYCSAPLFLVLNSVWQGQHSFRKDPLSLASVVACATEIGG